MYKIKLKKVSYKLCIVDQRLKCGFSLLETLIAITIISVGLVGVMGLIVHNISLAKVSPERVIAVNLAQEGIEVVRNIRDSNWLVGNAFNDGIVNSGQVISNTNVNYNSASVSNVSDELYLDGNNRYTHSGGTPTIFSRHLELDYTGDYIKIKSIVEWNTHTVTLEDYLYDWK